jgi:phage tail-like protein
MSCPPQTATFRLLDARVGWNAPPGTNLTGMEDPAGLRLAPAAGEPAGLTERAVAPWLPDPRLAPGPEPCAWYLAAPTGLLRRRRCTSCPLCAPTAETGPAEQWEPVWPADCDPGIVRAPTAVAARGHLLAVIDTEVSVWRREGEQLLAVIPGEATAVTVTPGGQVLLTRTGSSDLERYDLTGAYRGRIRTGIPGQVLRLASGQHGSVWVLGTDGGVLSLWTGTARDARFTPTDLAALRASAQPTTLAEAGDTGFCLAGTGIDGLPTASCFTWTGEPMSAGRISQPLATAGGLLTSALDSDIPRCRWHRVRIDADVPKGTVLSIRLATNEDASASPTDTQDWQTAPAGATDFLVEQPPGRYLYLQLSLTGDGTATPVVRQIRLDFPRTTSADLLPAVYRQDPAAEDFTERFLSLFDASVATLDRVIERYPALLDGEGVPDAVLPWLASLLGLSFEPSWDAQTRRDLLAAASQLRRKRGTPAGLGQAIKIIFGVSPVIEELYTARAWATVGGTTAPGVGRATICGARPLGAGRLFGRSTSRFRLGTSALSNAPLRGFGNPGDDALTQHAYRFRVLIPPGPPAAHVDKDALTRLLTQQAPAHTIGQIRTGRREFIIAPGCLVGIDTALRAPEPPVLRPPPAGRMGRSVRLSRNSIVWPARQGRRAGVRIGTTSVVGMTTVAQ